MDIETGTITQEWTQSAVEPPAPRRPKRWLGLSPRKRRIIATLAALALLAALVGFGLAAWYLDRFVIAHVEIDDVSAYEATVGAMALEPDEAAGDAGPTDGDTIWESTEEPTITDSTYSSSTVSITVTEFIEGAGDDQVTYFVAETILDDPSDLRAAFADNAFGTNITEDTSDIAEGVGAILAINGDYYGFRDTGIVIRNGVIYRDEPARTGLALLADGTMDIYDETRTSGDELVAAGVMDTWSFGPALVDDGEIVDGIDEVEVDGYFGKRSMQGENPRSAVGMIEPGHYVFVVVDGRADGYSAGITLPGLAELMQGLGCVVAYNLDGGGSATLYFNGEVVNHPVGTGEERGTSDIIYVTP